MSAPHGDPTQTPPGPWAGQGRYLGYGLTLAGTTFLFFMLGLWLDGQWGTSPFLAIGGALAGATAGFYNLYVHLILKDSRGKAEPGP